MLDLLYNFSRVGPSGYCGYLMGQVLTLHGLHLVRRTGEMLDEQKAGRNAQVFAHFNCLLASGDW